MHTVELLEEAIALAERLGYHVRQEWLGESGGGACQIKGRKSIFLDLAVGPLDQLEQVVATLRSEPDALAVPISNALRELFRVRKSA
jgi:hypothetical protein